MKLFDRSEPGAWVSGAAHAAILARDRGLKLGARLPDAEEGIAVEVVTDNQFAEMTRGERPPGAQAGAEAAVERVAETEEQPPGEASRDVPSPPTRPPEMTVAEREVAPPPAATSPSPRSSPRPRRRRARSSASRRPRRSREELAKLVEREAGGRGQAKAAARRRHGPRRSRSQAKAEADAKAKAEAEAKAKAKRTRRPRPTRRPKPKPSRKQSQAEAEARAKREAEVADRFNPGDIRKLLGLKEPAQSTGATGREVQRTAALGTATGNAQKLNPSQLGALKALLQDQIRTGGGGVPNALQSEPSVRPPDPAQPGRLARRGAAVLSRSPGQLETAVAEAALRAVRRSAPFRIPAQYAPFYEDWKELHSTPSSPPSLPAFPRPCPFTDRDPCFVAPFCARPARSPSRASSPSSRRRTRRPSSASASARPLPADPDRRRRFRRRGRPRRAGSGIIASNLKRSGYFAPLDKARHPERPSFDAAPQFEAWKAAGVQALVVGRVSRDPSGRLKTEFRLWDVLSGQQSAGQQYFTDPNTWRRVGHIISDAVYTKITGFGGFFDTRIAFVDERDRRTTAENASP